MTDVVATEGAAEPVPPAPKPRALRSTLIAVGGNGASQVLRLGSNLILTRLLFPEAFGLMAIVLAIVQGIQLVSDVGIIPSVVQHKRGDEPVFLDTAWTLAAIRGVTLFVVAVLIAWPLSLLYAQPELVTLIPAVATAALFAGFESTRVAQAWRHLQNGRIVLLDLGTQLAALAVNIGVAYVTRSVWALVLGIAVSQLLRMLATHLALPGRRNTFKLEKEAVRALLGFGKWVLLSTLISFLATRLDVLLLGKLLTIEALGIYSLATLLATLPTVVIGSVFGSVVTPLLARAARESHEELQRTYARVRGFLLPAVGFIVLGTALGAPGFFGLLYDARYADAMWIAPLLMVQVWWTGLHEAAMRVFVATGDAKPLVPSNAARLVVSAAGALIGHMLFGLVGFILGQAIGALAGLVYLDVTLEKRALPTLRQDLVWSVVVIGVGAATSLAARRLADTMALSWTWVSIGVGLVVLLLCAAVLGPRTLRAYRNRAA